MISGMLLASYSFVGGSFGNVLSQWEQLGFFSYILPFLLIFAIVLGVLNKTKIFEDNKPINVIIALSVGFMSLQWNIVPQFFSEIFPRVGIGLSFLLVAILFLGIFLPRENWAVYIFLVIGAIIALSIFVTSSDSMGWTTNLFGGMDFSTLILIIGLIAAIGAMVGALTKKDKKSFGDMSSSFLKDMHK
jgi:hypothetical protein